MAEFGECEKLQQVGERRHLSVLRDDLVIVRKVSSSMYKHSCHSLWSRWPCSIPPAAPRVGIRLFRWLRKHPHRPTTIFQSVLEPTKMKQRKR